jgi:hypothetical protein
MESPTSDVRRSTPLCVVLAFAAVTLACFWPLVRHPGDVLAGTARNGLNDVTGFYIGQRDFPRLCLTRHGQLPLWNPTTCGGAPYLGNPQAAFFYPPSWLFWALDARATVSWVLVAHHVAAGLGAFGLARACGASRLGACATGVAFLASPVLVARTSEGHMGTLGAVTWAPWAFWMYERYRRGDSPYGVGLAVALALSALAGHIQEAYYLVLALSLVCVYDAARLARAGDGAGAKRLLLHWPVVGMAAGGLAAAELIPMAVFARNSARTAGLFGGISAASSAGPANLAQLLRPFALGGPQTYHGPGSYFWESLCYFGVVPLGAAAAGLWCVLRERAAAGRVAAVGFVAFLFAMGGFTPLYPLMHRLVPGVRLFRFPSRALFLPALGVAVLFGRGVDRVARARVPGARALAAALVALAAAELGCFAQAVLRTVPAGQLRAADVVRRHGSASGEGGRVLARQQAESDREALIAGTLKVQGYDPIPLTRTLAFMSATGLDPSPVQAMFGIKPMDLSHASKPLLDLLGVRAAALLKSDNLPEGLGWRALGSARVPELVALRGAEPRTVECRVFENPDALPRAFAVGRVCERRSGGDSRAALSRLDPTREVLLDRDVLAPGPRQGFAPARVVEDTPNRVVVEVETERPGYLVLTDAWYPGWRAAVDTYPATVLPANVAFRAVALPSAGKHRVAFEYRAVGLLPGLAVSGLTLLLVLRALTNGAPTNPGAGGVATSGGPETEQGRPERDAPGGNGASPGGPGV